MNGPSSLRLLSALPVPDATWEPKEPATRRDHHPRGILRNVSGVHPVVVVGQSRAGQPREEPATTRRSGRTESA